MRIRAPKDRRPDRRKARRRLLAPERPLREQAFDARFRTADMPAALTASPGQMEALDGALVQFRRAVAARPDAAFGVATRGPGAALPYQAQLEDAFGEDLSGVRAHRGGAEARAGLHLLGARAAAHGDSIAFAEAQPDLHTVAHEVAHVLQQRAGGVAVQAKPTRVGAPADDAERRADAAADAVVSGTRVPDVGVAAGDTIHRLRTSGGEWSTTSYQDESSEGRLAVVMMLNFQPDAIAEGDGHARVGLVQAVRLLRGDSGQEQPSSISQSHHAVTSETPGHEGWAVDAGLTQRERTGSDFQSHVNSDGEYERIPSDDVPMTSPLYLDENRSDRAGPPRVAGSLEETGSAHANSDCVADGNGIANITDRPGMPADGRSVDVLFEVAAVVLDGARQGTYLGSVHWGFRATPAEQGNADSEMSVTLVPFAVASQTDPTADFFASARSWNAAQLQGEPATGAAERPMGSAERQDYDTVNLPLVASRMSTADLILALQDRESGGDAEALAAELATRHAVARVVGGDAAVTVALTTENGRAEASVTGEPSQLPLAGLLPIRQSLGVELPRGSGLWSPPFRPFEGQVATPDGRTATLRLELPVHDSAAGRSSAGNTP